MSVKLMGQVWGLELDHACQSIMLALADHAHDDGTRCFPSKEELAWKTGYSERQVQRILRRLESDECNRLIVAVKHEAGGWHWSTEYHLHLERGDKKTPLEKKRGDKKTPLKSEAPGVTSETGVTPQDDRGDISDQRGDIAVSERGDIAMTPEPSLTVIEEPSEEPSLAGAPYVSEDISDAPDSPKNSDASQTLEDTNGAPPVERTPWEPPDYWLPMTELEGYQHRNYGKYCAEVLEPTCQSQGVEPAAVVESFVAFYAKHRFRYGWTDPAATLRRTLVKEISNILGVQRGPPNKSLGARVRDVGKDIPIRETRRM